ncbi:MAG: UvrD-helicase domain-containing protein [Methyloceanibacter sp.]
MPRCLGSVNARRGKRVAEPDFDDLLYTARDLLVTHNNIRESLAKRFQHVLVDEFQDTDPLQIEILWRLCGEAPKEGDSNPLVRSLRPGALFLVGDLKQAILSGVRSFQPLRGLMTEWREYKRAAALLGIPQAAGVDPGSILRTNGLSTRSLRSASSTTRRGKLSRRVREPFEKASA